MKTKTIFAAFMALFFAIAVSAQDDHRPVEKKEMHKPYHKPVHHRRHYKKKVAPRRDVRPQDVHHDGQR